MDEVSGIQELRRKPYKRLTQEDIQEAVHLRANGVAVSCIATQLQVSERQLHRVLKNQANAVMGEPTGIIMPPKSKHVHGVIQENHSAWIFEELHVDPHITLESLANGLLIYFGLTVSPSTIWRHIRGGGLEEHGFPGFTKIAEEQPEQ